MLNLNGFNRFTESKPTVEFLLKKITIILKYKYGKSPLSVKYRYYKTRQVVGLYSILDVFYLCKISWYN